MAKKKCRVVFVEIGKELIGKEGAINKDLKKIGVSLNLFESKENGEKTYFFSLSRRITLIEYSRIRAVLRKHLGVKFGGAQ